MKKVQDERIIRERERLGSKAFGLALIGLWILISVRLFVFQQDPMRFIDIFLLTMLLSVYVLVGTIKQGNYLNDVPSKSGVKTILLGASVGTIVFGIVQVFFMDTTFSSLEDYLGFLIGLILFWGIWVSMQYLFTRLSKKQANKDY